jgi:hypothetical protein
MLHYYACGMTKMGEAEFWDAEFWQVQNRINAHVKMNELQEKGEWQRISVLGSWVLNMFAKKGKTIKPSKLIPQVWDGITKMRPDELSEEQKEERRKRWQRWDEEMKQHHGTD